MKQQIFYTKHAAGVTIYVDGRGTSISQSHPNYAPILEALRNKDFTKVVKLGNIGETIKAAAKAVAAGGRSVAVENDELVYINGTRKEKLMGPLAERIIDAVRNGMTEQSIRPLMMFMDNIMKNKLKDIRTELYDFMLAGKLPITNDGCFLAYKKIRNDYKDIHSGKLDNSPGRLVAMPAEKVDTDRNNECSTGLHFCSYDYLSNFGSHAQGGNDRIVIVKVNPRFVFAIPRDYNHTKCRCSEYYVVGEYKAGATEKMLSEIVFDEKSLIQVAPGVEFIKENTLKPSLAAMAQGYGLISKGNKALVRVETSKAAFAPEQYQIVVKKGKEYISVATGKSVPREHVKVMSITTKSVRAALVRAVARARNRR